MYNFIDVTEASEGNVLPSEALQLNGEFIENQISGYRTLNVSGREALSPELSAFETGVRDGSKLQNKRYPARTIIITYQLIAESNEAFREAYNKLGSILDVKDAELIFNDETDKFFIGTPSMIGEIEPGSNAVVGQIEIFCADPFKYSVIEYEADASLDESSVLIDYNGTYKAFPTFEVEFYKETEVEEDGETAGTLTGNGDCGYVAFFNEDEKIIQIGNPEEVDGETAARSQTLVNQTFTSPTAWGTTTQSLWKVNDATVPTVPLVEVTKTGNVAMQGEYVEATTIPTTSGTLIDVWSDSDEPKFHYVVTAQVTDRTETTAKVTVAITTSLRYRGSYFGNGFILTGSLYMNGSWHDVTLKTSGEYWRGTTAHTANLSFTISGLSASTTSISSIFKVSRGDSKGGGAGILSDKSCNNLAIAPYVTPAATEYYLAPSTYGSGNSWHGPSITRTIPADAAGEVGAKDFTFTWTSDIYSRGGYLNQLGAFQCVLSDDSGNVVAGARVVKNQFGSMGNICMYVGNRNVSSSLQINLDRSLWQRISPNEMRPSKITKEGNKVSFQFGKYYCYDYIDDSISDSKVTKITFVFEGFGGNPTLTYNGLLSAKFVKNNCDTWYNIPNKFSTNDVLEVDCKNGEIFLNGASSPNLGALGNDWEGLYLTQGLNQIGFSYSDWVTDDYAPTIKVKYREVFL